MHMSTLYVAQSSVLLAVRESGTVAWPGFVARRGKDGNYVMGHSLQSLVQPAAAARVTNALTDRKRYVDI